jgi:hypothetical protein
VTLDITAQVTMPNIYTSYYANQAGGALPAFQGTRTQRGHGFFGRLFSQTVPHLLKQLFPVIRKQALTTGVGLAQDLLAGTKFKSAAKSRIKEAGSNLAEEALSSLKSQKGSGRMRKKRTVKRCRVVKSVKKRRTNIKRRKTRSTTDFL